MVSPVEDAEFLEQSSKGWGRWFEKFGMNIVGEAE